VLRVVVRDGREATNIIKAARHLIFLKGENSHGYIRRNGKGVFLPRLNTRQRTELIALGELISEDRCLLFVEHVLDFSVDESNSSEKVFEVGKAF